MTPPRDFPLFTKVWAQHSILRWSLAAERSLYTPEQQKQITSRLKAAARKFDIKLPDVAIWSD
jgi:hypothetical protein